MNKRHIKWPLFFYDAILFLALDALLLWLYGGEVKPTFIGLVHHAILSFVSVMTMRFIFGIYSEIWRYGSIEIYIKLIISDGIAFWLYFILAKALPIQQITFVKMIALVTMNLLASLCLRMCYRYAYKCATPNTARGRFLSSLLRVFAGIKDNRAIENRNVKVAIYGAGSLGVQLYEDIYINKQYPYEVRCFIDRDLGKRGRSINGIKVIGEEEAQAESLIRDYSIQEVFFAIHNLDPKKMEELYTEYTKAGLKVKNYDVPHVLNPESKGTLKEITDNHITEICEMFDKRNGRRIDIKYGITVEKEEKGIFFLKDSDITYNEYEVEVPSKLILPDGNFMEFKKILWNKGQKISNEVCTKFFDYDRIKDRLLVRNRRKDDYLVVNSAGNRKKLNRYFIDCKIPEHIRDSIFLLADGDHIMWVPGGRISEEYKITEDTKNVLCVECGGSEWKE